MFILGLTGSIGMGKSWGAKCFRQLGIPVHDADGSVHRLMAPGGKAVQDIQEMFGDVLHSNGGIDRQKLGGRVLGNDDNLTALENVLHPLVKDDQRAFLKRCRCRSEKLVVLDIPLLFETHARAKVDGVVVMSAPSFVQAQRVLRRPAMTVEKFQHILARQIDDSLKRQFADYVVSTGGSRGQSLRQIASIAKICQRQRGSVWSPRWGL